MIYRPDLVTDPLAFEKNDQDKTFAAHRYDQTILSVIARYYEKSANITISNEESEGQYANQIVKASRRVDKVEEHKIKSLLKSLYYRIKK